MNGPRADAIEVLDDWRPVDPQQDSLRHAFRALLDARTDACLRSCVPGHVTASAVLVDADATHTMLTLHPRVGAWLQLGGHCETADESLAGAALREATEESGVAGLIVDPDPVHLAVHPITCSLGQPTRHFDVRFVVRAPAGAEPVRSEESLDLRWWPLSGAPANSDLEPLLTAARARL